METARFLYKCRRCEQIVKDTECQEKDGHKRLLEAIMKMDLFPEAPGMKLSLIETHICADGAMGVTDLIGYEKG